MSGFAKNMRWEHLRSGERKRAGKAKAGAQKLYMGNRGLDAFKAS